MTEQEYLAEVRLWYGQIYPAIDATLLDRISNLACTSPFLAALRATGRDLTPLQMVTLSIASGIGQRYGLTEPQATKMLREMTVLMSVEGE